MSDVLVPQMGESVLEGTILQWKVKVGDKVEINQPLVELATDKVNVEIPAESAGVITGTYATQGQVVRVGAVIAKIEDGKAGSSSPDSHHKSAPVAAAPKSTPAPSSPSVAAPAQTQQQAAVKGTAAMGKGKLSPKVRMLIREYGLDANSITPTGKDGLVTVEDVTRTVNQRTASAGFTTGPIPSPTLATPTSYVTATAKSQGAPHKPLVQVQIPVFPPLPEAQKVTRMPLQGVRKLIADHMVKSKHTSPHVTTFEDIDFTELVNYRQDIKEDFIKTYGVNITYMPFIIKAATTAIREYPTLNASLTDSEIILKNYVNIGFAVAREDGLIVPVIKNADKKTIVELAVEINSLGEKARTNKLLPDDISDGTFTVTNAGMFGATASTPIISQPQVAILGVHAIVEKPWVVKRQIVIRNISTFGMSFDHRLIDGHTAVQFLHKVHEYLADPRKLLLSLR